MGEDGFGMIKCIALIVHFISIIMTSVSPQIFRHQILEVRDPCLGELWSVPKGSASWRVLLDVCWGGWVHCQVLGDVVALLYLSVWGQSEV